MPLELSRFMGVFSYLHYIQAQKYKAIELILLSPFFIVRFGKYKESIIPESTEADRIQTNTIIAVRWGNVIVDVPCTVGSNAAGYIQWFA